MLKPSIVRFIAFVGVAAVAAGAFAQRTPSKAVGGPAPDQTSTYERVARTIVVTFESAAAARAIDSSLPQGCFVSRDVPRLNIQGIETPSPEAANRLIQTLKANKSVKSVHGDIFFKTEGFPNDPMYPRQYAHFRTQTFAAWGITTGNPSVTVAVLDTGIDSLHPEFAGRIVNPMSFVASEPFIDDGNGHGTHTAGIASAKGDNGIGVAGVSWNSMIMPVKVLNSRGSGSFVDVIAGIVAASDAGANVVSMSIGGYGFGVPRELSAAVDYALAKNTLVVASSGNDGIDLDTFFLTHLPSGYGPVYGVAASNSRNQLAYFSNYGQTVDIVAPGDSILSTLPKGYGYESGTSMACPYISGVAALIYSVYGASATPTSVQDAINRTAMAGPKGCAHGLVNTFAALRGLDFASTFDVTPASVNIVYGSLSGGTPADLNAVDDSFFTVSSANVPLYGPAVVFDTTYALGDVTNLTSVLLRNYVKASAPTNSTLEIWDPAALKWVTFSSQLVSAGKSKMWTFLYTTDIVKYVDAYGVLKVRYTGATRLRRFGESKSTSFSVSTDAQGLKLFTK